MGGASGWSNGLGEELVGGARAERRGWWAGLERRGGRGENLREGLVGGARTSGKMWQAGLEPLGRVGGRG